MSDSRETHLFRLWFWNEQGTIDYWTERAADILHEDDDYPRVTIADAIREEYEDAAPELDGVFADLLTYALGNVDWHDLADELIAYVKDQD